MTCLGDVDFCANSLSPVGVETASAVHLAATCLKEALRQEVLLLSDRSTIDGQHDLCKCDVYSHVLESTIPRRCSIPISGD